MFFVVVFSYFAPNAFPLISRVPDLAQSTTGTGIEPSRTWKGPWKVDGRLFSALSCHVKFSQNILYFLGNCRVLVLQATKLWLLKICLGVPRPSNFRKLMSLFLQVLLANFYFSRFRDTSVNWRVHHSENSCKTTSDWCALDLGI